MAPVNAEAEPNATEANPEGRLPAGIAERLTPVGWKNHSEIDKKLFFRPAFGLSASSNGYTMVTAVPPPRFQRLSPTSKSPEGTNVAEKDPRILCLDDHPDNLRIRKMLLEKFGCEVITVTSSQECLRIAAAEPLDLILLDYHLGGSLNGEEVALDLHTTLPNLPLVMLTGDPNVPQSVRGCVDALLIKGQSNPGDLLRTIQDLLPDYDLRQRHESIVSSIFDDSSESYGSLHEVRKPSAGERNASPVTLRAKSN